MKNLAIIPARSGSKGIKDKNIKLLDGRPLIDYSIKAALESGIFDEVMLSTDSTYYAEIGANLGAKVPFLRSQEMSSDTASSWDAVLEVVENYVHYKNIEFDTVMLLQPTSPLRESHDIKKVYDLFIEKKAHAVVSCCEAEHSPLWSSFIGDDLRMDGFANHDSRDNRQEHKKYYRLNGAIYMLDMFALYNIENLYINNCFAYVMPQNRSVDIDSELDFKIAEVIIHENEKI